MDTNRRGFMKVLVGLAAAPIAAKLLPDIALPPMQPHKAIEQPVPPQKDPEFVFAGPTSGFIYDGPISIISFGGDYVFVPK